MNLIQRDIAPIYTQVTEQQQIKKLEYIGSHKPHPGHRCYELNLETMGIQEATFEQVTAHFGEWRAKDYQPRKKLVVKPGHLYTTALNQANALKKFTTMLKSVKP